MTATQVRTAADDQVTRSPYPSIAPAGGDTATPLNLTKRLRLMRRHVDVHGQRLVDCGCGSGDYVVGLRAHGAKAWGLEYSREKVFAATREATRRLAVADLQHIPLRDDSVDIALLNEVLEHVPDDRAAVREVYRVLRPGGILMVFSPNRRYPFETHGALFRWSDYRIPHYVPFVPYLPVRLASRLVHFWARNYWPRELRRMVVDAGFAIRSTDYVWQTFEGISRHQPRFITRSRTILQQLSAVLEGVPLVRTFGASQFIVARKPLS